MSSAQSQLRRLQKKYLAEAITNCLPCYQLSFKEPCMSQCSAQYMAFMSIREFYLQKHQKEIKVKDIKKIEQALRMREVDQTAELVMMLRAIVSDQQKKIVQLQSDIRVWENKYKRSLFGDGGSNRSKQGIQLQELRKGLNLIEEQYRSTAIGLSIKQAANCQSCGRIEATVRLVSQLCSKIQGAQAQVTRQGLIIGQQAMVMEQKALQHNRLKDRVEEEMRKAERQLMRAEQQEKKVQEIQLKIDSFKRQFTRAKTQAQQYQNKLLAEVKRLQMANMR